MFVVYLVVLVVVVVVLNAPVLDVARMEVVRAVVRVAAGVVVVRCVVLAVVERSVCLVVVVLGEPVCVATTSGVVDAVVPEVRAEEAVSCVSAVCGAVVLKPDEVVFAAWNDVADEVPAAVAEADVTEVTGAADDVEAVEACTADVLLPVVTAMPVLIVVGGSVILIWFLTPELKNDFSRSMRHIPKHTVSIMQQLRAMDVRFMNTAFFLDLSFSYSSLRRKTLFAMSL